MFSPQNSFDYSQPLSQPSGSGSKRKKLLIIIAIVAVIIIGIIIFVAIKSPASQGILSGRNDKELSLEEKFIDNLDQGNIGELAKNSKLFSNKTAAADTVDWVQPYLDLDSCSKKKDPLSLEKENITYYQQGFECNRMISKDDKQTKQSVPKQNMFITTDGKQVLYFQVVASPAKAFSLTQLQENFKW